MIEFLKASDPIWISSLLAMGYMLPIVLIMPYLVGANPIKMLKIVYGSITGLTIIAMFCYWLFWY